jgi:multicomponent Na+:H+ antiporter subunit C
LSVLPFAVAAWIFLVGLYGVITSRNLIHMIICISVAQSSTYVLLLGIGYRANASAPIFYQLHASTPAVDPVVQALTLTDVVVGVTVTALLLSLALQAHKRFGTLDPEALKEMRG